MITSIIIFFLAFIGMAAIVAVKHFELEKGREFIFIRWRRKIDSFAHISFAKTKLFVVKKEHQAVSFVKDIPARVLNWVSTFNEFLHKKYGKHIDMIKGRSVPENKNSASFFVNAISEYKKDLEEVDLGVEKK